MRHGDITLGWADGDYTFRLAWGELIAVQEACDAGPAEILRRIGDGSWRVQDLGAVILHGLLGGGCDPAVARKLVKRYVHENPLAESVPVAQAVLLAAISGVDDDPADVPAGKPKGA